METKKNRRESKFLLRELNAEQRLWMLVDPARKIRIETNCIWDDDSLVAEVIDNTLVEEHCVSFMMVLMKSLEKIDRT
jgi:hypothetical protein